MSGNGRAEQKAEQESIRRNLEGILNSEHLPQMPHSELVEKIQHPDTRTLKLYDVKDESFDEAEDTIDAMIEFYLDPVLEKKPHVKRKKKADIIALTHIFFQLKTQQHAVIKLLEEIDMGNMNVKLFEVLERMQARLESLTKSQMMYRHALEESYKKVKEDDLRAEASRPKKLDVEHDGHDAKPEIIDGEPYKSRGTKNIINSLNVDTVGSGSLNDSGGLVDARSRPESPHPEQEQKHENTDPNYDDEMFGPIGGGDNK